MKLLNKIRSGVKFIKSPRDFINKKVESRIQKVCEANFLNSINNFKETDIFIVGYPKSGNTWMQSLVSGLLYGIDTNFLPDRLAQEIVPDVHARQFYTRFGDINFFKSHHLPKPEYRRVIYLVRDGRDVMASYYAYNKVLGNNITLEDMIKKGEGLFPSKWKDHLSEWLDNPFNSEMIIIRYEDLLMTPEKVLERICEFAGLKRSDLTIKQVIEGNTFQNMRDKAKKYNGMGHRQWEGEKALMFFRNGKKGSYKNEIPDHLITYFLEESEEVFKKIGYEI